MNGHVERSAEWIYHGVWSVLAKLFRVPQHPPSMPMAATDFCRSFHPSRKYLAYLKLYFWVLLVLIDVAILAGWALVLVWSSPIAWILALPALLIAVVPDILAYIAIHLRYDTMWYVATDRSLRVRRGIWVIAEHTITYENVQNAYVQRGPIEQLFGIATLVVETAGASDGESENPFAAGNQAVMQGLDNPEEIRDLILERVRATRSAGLGDEQLGTASSGLSPRHIALFREIRDEVRAMA